MFRVALYGCVAALDRIDYLITLMRLGVLDRFAGPMPEKPVGAPGENWTKYLGPPPNTVDRGMSAPTGIDSAGDPTVEAAPPALAAD